MNHPPRNARLRGFFKWSLIASLVLAGLSWYAARRALAELGNAALAMGPELAQVSKLLGPSTTVELNGQRMHLLSTVSELPIADLLHNFRSLCERESGGLADELRAQQRALRDDETQAALGISRESIADRVGSSACLARGSRGGASELSARALAFVKSGDLSALGQLRYVFARRNQEGKTHAIFVWNEGPLKVAGMFPKTGDAAGADFADVPRPTGARRLISAQATSSAYGLLAYEVGQRTPEAALAAYDRTLEHTGYQSVRLGDLGSSDHLIVAFVRDAVPLQVHALRHGERTVIAVLRMGGRTHETFAAP